MGKETFIIRTEWYDAIKELSEPDKAKLTDCLFRFHLGYFDISEIDSIPLKIIWKMIEPNLLRNIEMYDKRKETSSINGKLGGRPKKKENLNNLNKPNDNLTKPNESLSVLVLEPVIDKNININNININNEFENFRKLYPGAKRGFETEFSNFKKHKDYKEAVFLLTPALEKLKHWREQKKLAGGFVPEMANLQTWINQRRWEVELEKIDKNKTSHSQILNEVPFYEPLKRD